MKNRQQRHTNSSFKKHIKYELNCGVVGSPGGRDLFMNYYAQIINTDSFISQGPSMSDASTMRQTACQSSSQKRRSSTLRKKEHLSQKYNTVTDGNQVYTRTFQIHGAGEAQTSPKALTQQSDCFIVCVAGDTPETPSQNNSGRSNLASTGGGIQLMSPKESFINGSKSSQFADEYINSPKSMSTIEKEEDKVCMSDFLLENQQLSYLKNLPHKIEQWVDDLQETAMIDVPIIIFFCTQVKPMNVMQRIIAERDNPDFTEQLEKNEFILSMIKLAKCYFSPYKNIHIYSGSKNIDVDQLMISTQSIQDEETLDTMKVSKKQLPQLNIEEVMTMEFNVTPSQEKSREITMIEQKYTLNLDDVIMELSEEQVSSHVDHSQKNLFLESFFQDKYSLRSNFQSRRNSCFNAGADLINFNNQERKTFIQKGQSDFLFLKDSSSFVKLRSRSFRSTIQDQQQSPAESTTNYKLGQQMNVERAFKSNLSSLFSLIYEAGYLFRYKDIIWNPDSDEDDDDFDDEDEDDDSSKEDDDQTNQLRKLTTRRSTKQLSLSPRQPSEIDLSGNYEKNKHRQQSFKLHEVRRQSVNPNGRQESKESKCCL